MIRTLPSISGHGGRTFARVAHPVAVRMFRTWDDVVDSWGSDYAVEALEGDDVVVRLANGRRVMVPMVEARRVGILGDLGATTVGVAQPAPSTTSTCCVPWWGYAALGVSAVAIPVLGVFGAKAWKKR